MTAFLPRGSVLPWLKSESASFPVSAATGLGTWWLCPTGAFAHGQWEERQLFPPGSLSCTLFIQEFATLLNVSLLEINTITLIEKQLKPKHFLLIYTKVSSTQSKRTGPWTNPMCVLPLLHHRCISPCHSPQSHRLWVGNVALLPTCSLFGCHQFSMMGAE